MILLVQSQAYGQQYGFNSIHLLPMNLYGSRDNFDPNSSHVIPALIKRCVEAKESGAAHIEAWDDGSPTREFLCVEHAAETIARLAGFEGEIRWDPTKPNGQPRRKLDVTRAEKEFGFKSITSFEQGLKQTIEWYLGNR